MREFSGLDRRNALNSVRGCPKARAAVLHGFKDLYTGKKYSRKSDDRKGMNIEAKVQ
jgi:hypothetical protein